MNYNIIQLCSYRNRFQVHRVLILIQRFLFFVSIHLRKPKTRNQENDI
jgi:hypothetical protein